MKSFVIVLVVAGTLIGLGVVLLLEAHSKIRSKGISQAMNALHMSFSADRSFWASREWNDTHFVSQYKDITGSLKEFTNQTVQAEIDAVLQKSIKKQTQLIQGQITVNGIQWAWAIGTFKVEAGALARTLYAATGNGNIGLLFCVNMSRYKDLYMIPDDAVDCVLSCFQVS